MAPLQPIKTVLGPCHVPGDSLVFFWNQGMRAPDFSGGSTYVRAFNVLIEHEGSYYHDSAYINEALRHMAGRSISTEGCRATETYLVALHRAETKNSGRSVRYFMTQMRQAVTHGAVQLFAERYQAIGLWGVQAAAEEFLSGLAQGDAQQHSYSANFNLPDLNRMIVAVGRGVDSALSEFGLQADELPIVQAAFGTAVRESEARQRQALQRGSTILAERCYRQTAAFAQVAGLPEPKPFHLTDEDHLASIRQCLSIAAQLAQLGDVNSVAADIKRAQRRAETAGIPFQPWEREGASILWEACLIASTHLLANAIAHVCGDFATMDALLSRAQHYAEMAKIPFDQCLAERLRTYNKSAVANNATMTLLRESYPDLANQVRFLYTSLPPKVRTAIRSRQLRCTGTEMITPKTVGDLVDTLPEYTEFPMRLTLIILRENYRREIALIEKAVEDATDPETSAGLLRRLTRYSERLSYGRKHPQ